MMMMMMMMMMGIKYGSFCCYLAVEFARSHLFFQVPGRLPSPSSPDPQNGHSHGFSGRVTDMGTSKAPKLVLAPTIFWGSSLPHFLFVVALRRWQTGHHNPNNRSFTTEVNQSRSSCGCCLMKKTHQNCGDFFYVRSQD